MVGPSRLAARSAASARAARSVARDRLLKRRLFVGGVHDGDRDVEFDQLTLTHGHNVTREGAALAMGKSMHKAVRALFQGAPFAALVRMGEHQGV
jgi:hypothetical protein